MTTVWQGVDIKRLHEQKQKLNGKCSNGINSQCSHNDFNIIGGKRNKSQSKNHFPFGYMCFQLNCTENDFYQSTLKTL